MADNAYKRGVRAPDGNARPALHLRCPVLIPMMVVPPDLPQVEGGAAAKVNGRVLLAHAPMVVVRKALVGTAVIAYGVEIKLQEDQVLVLLGGWSPKPMVLVTRPGVRQTVARTELVDRAGLTVIAGEDTSLGPF